MAINLSLVFFGRVNRKHKKKNCWPVYSKSCPFISLTQTFLCLFSYLVMAKILTCQVCNSLFLFLRHPYFFFQFKLISHQHQTMVSVCITFQISSSWVLRNGRLWWMGHLTRQRKLNVATSCNVSSGNKERNI